MKLSMKYDHGDSFKRKRTVAEMEREIRSRLTFPSAEKLKISVDKDLNVTIDGPADLLAQADKLLKT